MSTLKIADKISQLTDTEIGGDNALDGFEFQLSSAIYLMFENVKEDMPFALLYEKIEDFIIITEKISLYQSKGINTNITLGCLTQNRSKSKDKKESIIEKMYDNYLEIKENFSEMSVETTLVTCTTKKFSTNLWNSKKEAPESLNNMDKLCFEDIGDQIKEKIVEDTKHDSYDWHNIMARRLIPKSHHEEVTRVFIEDVITEKFGPNKINSRALYGSLLLKIKSIRKSKKSLNDKFLNRELRNYLKIDNDKEYHLVSNNLNDEDQKNLSIKRSFDSYKNMYVIEHYEVNKDYELLKTLYDLNAYNNIDNFYKDIINNPLCKDLILRLKEHEIKALILLVI